MDIDLEKIKENKSIKELLEFSIVNIDKPTGPTSFTVDEEIKKSLDLTKTSHFGTLDPIVTGVLPIALNRACRLMPYFIGNKKTYVGIMRVHEEISEEEIKKQIKQFIGKIIQLPPVKSRVKRQEREREIYTFEILEKKDKDFVFKTEVQAGTYIRKLIHDLGEKIGGAHMLELRRTKASIFEESSSITLFNFLEAVKKYDQGNEKPLREILIPGEIISTVLPVIEVKKQYVNKLYHGSRLLKEHTIDYKNPDSEKLAVFCKDKFIGVFTKINSDTTIGQPEFIFQPLKNKF